MLVEILSIGNEVLNGSVVNSNAAFLSRQMAEIDCKIVRHTVVCDEFGAIASAFQEAFGRADVVIATGGLGSTIDDLTQKTAKDWVGSQAKSVLLKNRIGFAPGTVYFFEKKALILLPGVPREMQAMFLHEAKPRLVDQFALKPRRSALDLFLCPMSERDVDPILRNLREKYPDIEIGIYPSLGSLKVRFEVDCNPERLKFCEEAIQKAFPTYLFEGPSLVAAVHRELILASQTLGAAESCTGGAISKEFVSLPDASKYFLGGLVVYSNEWKETFLHVKRETLKTAGAVSREAIAEMLAGIFEQTKADWAIAVSGIAGPSGGTLEKPIGTIYCGIGKRGEADDIGKILAPADRASAIEFATQHAIGALFRRLRYQTRTFSESS